MSRSALVARAQARAEAGMTDTCVIRRRTGTTTDRATGRQTATYATPNPYEGRCRLQQVTAAATDAQVAEADVLMVTRYLQLPLRTSEGVRAGDVVTVTASADPGLIGRTFTVHAEFGKTDVSSRRLGIREATS